MKRIIHDYLEDILNECAYIVERSRMVTYQEFLCNEDLKRAFVRSLEVIGEAYQRKFHSISVGNIRI